MESFIMDHSSLQSSPTFLSRIPWARMVSKVTTHRLAVLIILSHFLLSSLYSVCIPIWEANDEWAHYGYVKYLLTNHTLPRTSGQEVSRDPDSELYELTQPPLYYIIVALATSWVDTRDGLRPTLNPHAYSTPVEGGVNLFIHTEEEAFPYRGTVLAVHVGRLISVLISTMVVWVTYLLGCSIFPERKEIALGAMAINALAPQFLFVGSVLNNDIMITLFSALVFFTSARLLTGEAKMADFLGLGLFLGLAFLSKYNALALIPTAFGSAIFAVGRTIRSGKGRMVLIGGGLFLSSLALAAAWWLLRNIVLFGAPITRYSTVTRRLIRYFANPSTFVTRIHWDMLPQILRYGFVTFWASFGWCNIRAERWVYQALIILCLAGLLGLLIFMLKKGPSARLNISLLLLGILSFLALAAIEPLSAGRVVLRGRYLLPSISAISVILSLGLSSLLPSRRWASLPLMIVGGGLFIWAIVTPFHYILPAYAKPPILSESDLKTSNPVGGIWGNKIELLRYELNPTAVKAGQAIRVTLYWRCLEEMEENYTVAVHILGPDYKAYGKRHLYPGNGNYATSLWKEGEIIKDEYRLVISPRFPAPAFAQIKVALYLYPSERYLPLLDAQGKPKEDYLVFGRFKVATRKALEPQIEKPVYFEFGGIAALVGYDMEGPKVAGEPLKVRLYWRSLAETDKDYTVFIHLRDEEDNLWGQSDSQPRGGYYPTSLWEKGEVTEDEHYISLPEGIPPGDYRLILGLYFLDTMERLPAFDQKGQRLLHDEITIEGVEIGP